METKKVDNTSGNRFTFFELINKYNVQIPIIQRDYAQGRASEIEVRDAFLDSLYIYLQDNRKNRDLDFIYGIQTDKNIDDEVKFIPLDGQQRLTTLFLLHWYLAKKDDAIDILKTFLVKNQNSKNPKSKFSYETRTSSREFCDALLNNDLDIKHLFVSDDKKPNSLSKHIKDSSWYFSSWDTDPTIKSMLVMLDAIHAKFQNTSGFFERLISDVNPVITFQFLDLEEFNLTDDLYIKMNARGIPLTSFENFKVKFEQFIKNSEFNNKHNYPLEFNGALKDVDVKTYFSHKIDTDWANFFWNYTLKDKKSFDKLIMNFIRAIIVNHYAATSDKDILKYLIDKKNENISYHQYAKLINFDEQFVFNIINILDLIKNSDNKYNKYLKEFYYYNEDLIFETVINNTFNQAGYVERIQFHAYCLYLINFGNGDGLSDWMRIVHNLSVNTIYNNETDFIKSITGINALIKEGKKILDYLISAGKIEGFDNAQVKEEKIKAVLISKSSKWKDLIYDIERHDYFKGQIGFLLYLSGIDEYFDKNKNCDWTEVEDLVFTENFMNYCEKSRKIFNDKGLTKYPEFIWERALLSKGDYLIKEGRNQSFLINSDRDISWKRLLKGDKEIHHQKIVKEIFDVIDVNNIVQSLTFVQNNNTINDWRKKFIELPRLFEYLGTGKRYIRKESNHGFVLFNGERMSGAHAELYSYSFYLEHLENHKFNPFEKCYYYFANGDDKNERPCAVINSWSYSNSEYEIRIYYSLEQSKYELCFYEEFGNFNDNLTLILQSNGFKLQNDSYLFYLSESEILPLLKTLCESFQKV